MRSRASLLSVAALLAAPAGAQAPLPPDAGAPAGPSGTSGAGKGPRADMVIPADVDPAVAGIAAATAALPPGSHAEVTSLASGRTILVGVVPGGSSLHLSPAAATALGIAGATQVRIRAVAASAADVAALRNGTPASPRLDTPEAVLRALRRQSLAAPHASRGATVADASPPPPAPLRPPAAIVGAGDDVPATTLVPPAAPARFVVRVGAFAQERPARDLARRAGAAVVRAGPGWQVQFGPFAGLPGAQAARDDAVARGYADAAIFIAD